jgi:pimeloyl-ACP methyl ester carboxylesterase
MKRSLSMRLAGLLLAAGLVLPAPGFALGLDVAFPEPASGPGQAKGVVVWSHGRSINTEDSKSPTPAYLRALRDDGWDVLRFDRPSRGDTLSDSTKRLVEHAAALKHKGYKQVVLAGQSFGAFLSLMAADASSEVDAVIATAPAAYGSFEDFYDSWHLNATKLYPLIEQVRRARIMMFYFHGDSFDPGGRGERSRQILAQRGLGFAVIDQPAHLTTHWAASSGLFLRRFGSCIRDFANNATLAGEMVCAPGWGTMPSAELKLPADLAEARPRRTAAAGPARALPQAPLQGPPQAPTRAPTGSGTAPDNAKAAVGFRDVWYGFYPNGREVLLGVEAAQGDNLTAIYAIGPSIDNAHAANWVRRKGRVTGDGFVFEEPGKSTLRFRPRQDGGLAATWTAANGKTSMNAHLKPIDPGVLAARQEAKPSAAVSSTPVSATASDGDRNQPQN